MFLSLHLPLYSSSLLKRRHRVRFLHRLCHSPAPLIRSSTLHIANYKPKNFFVSSSSSICPLEEKEECYDGGRSLLGAMSLIVGTAVGPGMLGLPSATLRSGQIPSFLMIILTWVYVISSILLIADLTFSIYDHHHNSDEITFTTLTTTVFAPPMAAFIAIIYACLNFALILASISGLATLLLQSFPTVFTNPILAHLAFPTIVGAVIGFLPFSAIDAVNRLLCSLMIFSISTLVFIGFSVGKADIVSSFTTTASSSWKLSSILPAVPVTVLTLGFHVITPFMCTLLGKSRRREAKKAILLGGSVPLLMVLSWNLVVLGLSGRNSNSGGDPIQMLLSVSPSALPAVRGFAISALATSLIGYSLSFPKQLLHTITLISSAAATTGETKSTTTRYGGVAVMCMVLGMAVMAACMLKGTAFTKALEFAGVYANCFLFGILPPAMTWIYGKRIRGVENKDGIGNRCVLLALFVCALVLFFCH